MDPEYAEAVSAYCKAWAAHDEYERRKAEREAKRG